MDAVNTWKALDAFDVGQTAAVVHVPVLIEPPMQARGQRRARRQQPVQRRLFEHGQAPVGPPVVQARADSETAPRPVGRAQARQQVLQEVEAQKEALRAAVAAAWSSCTAPAVAAVDSEPAAEGAPAWAKLGSLENELMGESWLTHFNDRLDGLLGTSDQHEEGDESREDSVGLGFEVDPGEEEVSLSLLLGEEEGAEGHLLEVVEDQLLPCGLASDERASSNSAAVVSVQMPREDTVVKVVKETRTGPTAARTSRLDRRLRVCSAFWAVVLASTLMWALLSVLS